MKDKVLKYWSRIEKLSRNRFPNDENLSLEATQYVLTKLEENDWKRVRAYQGKGFSAFITTVTLRLLSDFWNDQFGKLRPNTWLKTQTEPLYKTAYALLVKSRYSRQETVGILSTIEPKREPWFLREVVNSIMKNCPMPQEHQSCPLPEEFSPETESVAGDDNDVVEHISPYLSPLKQVEMQDAQQLLEFLQKLLQGSALAPDDETHKLLKRLSQSIHLNAEDSLLLKMRYQSGLAVSEMARVLGHLTASQVDKRLKKIIKSLCLAFKRERLVLQC
jgi:hypothetical protein